MKKSNRLLVTAGIAGMLWLGAGHVLAQGGGAGGGAANPAQFVQQLLQNVAEGSRSQLEVTNDDEWLVIRDRIQKVLQARLDVTQSSMGGMMGMARGGRGGGANGGQGGGRGGFGNLFGAPSPEDDALQKALDAGASNAQLKAAVAKVVAARKAKQTKLEKAQDELRKVLSVRQEAIASLSGLL